MSIYRTEQLKPNLYCIRETESVNIYVILGKEKALVLDTGYGYIDLRTEIRKITDMDYIVALTHGDPDHALGSYWFDEVYVHPYDVADMLKDDTPEMKQRAIDHRLHKMPELETEIPVETYLRSSLKKVNFLPLQEGDVLDIGDLAFHIIWIPGHSRGSIAFYEPNQKWLFTGDTITTYNVWNIGAFPDHCEPLSVFMNTLKKVKQMGKQIGEIYPAHGKKPLDPSILDEQMDCLRDLLRNHDQDEALHTFAGDGFRHTYHGLDFLYTKAMLDEALKNGIE